MMSLVGSNKVSNVVKPHSYHSSLITYHLSLITYHSFSVLKDSFVYKILISLHLDIFRQKTGHNRLIHIYLKLEYPEGMSG